MSAPEPAASGVSPSLVVRRWLDAPREVVFAAWCEPDRMKHWLHPGPEWSNPVVEVDLRPGGAYRLGFKHRDSPEVVFVVGRYLEVEPPARLVCTWTWEPPDPHAGVETLVTVELAATRGGTDVSVTHERFPDEPTRRRHADGWAETLTCLADHLGDL